ncbi:MAG: hypothetical protein Q9227_001842 [Pyrenula ochraceoflavens]
MATIPLSGLPVFWRPGKCNIRTISVYTAADAASAHVELADEAVLLSGPDSKAYIDG